MEIIEVTIESKRPLLFNRLTEQQLQNLWDRKKAPKNAPRPLPREWARERLYLTEDKKLPYIPSEMLMSCLIGGGKFIRLEGKKMVSTEKKTVLPGLLQLLDPFILLKKPDSNDAPDWEVDMRGGRNPNGGEAVCIVRPRFDAWRATFQVRIDTDKLAETTFRELFDVAGSNQGLGDFRPEKKGTFGIWHVTHWKRVAA